jgi:hypothetical protein
LVVMKKYFGALHLKGFVSSFTTKITGALHHTNLVWVWSKLHLGHIYFYRLCQLN